MKQSAKKYFAMVIGDCMPKHRLQKFICFLKKIDTKTLPHEIPFIIFITTIFVRKNNY